MILPFSVIFIVLQFYHQIITKERFIMSKFPKGFLVGAATAAHQVEGNNTNSDCWAQELSLIHISEPTRPY